MTAGVAKELQESESKEVRSDDPDDFIEEIDSPDDVQDQIVNREDSSTNLKLTPKNPQPQKICTSKIFEPETVKKRQVFLPKGTPKPVAPILPNTSVTQKLPLNRQQMFHNVSPPAKERKKTPPEQHPPAQLSEGVSIVQNGVNMIPVQIPGVQKQCICTCTCGARPGAQLNNPQNFKVFTMDQLAAFQSGQPHGKVISIPEQPQLPISSQFQKPVPQLSELQKRKYPYVYTAEEFPKKTKSFNPPHVSIIPQNHLQSKYSLSLLPGLPTSNQTQPVISPNRMMPPQPLTMQKQQIVYRPQKAAAPPISSCSISIAQQVPVPSMPLTSMPTVSIPQQSSTTPVRTKESSPEDEEINVTEVEEKIDIKEEQKDEEEIEEISNPRTTHAPQTDILFKAIEAMQKKEKAQKEENESKEESSNNLSDEERPISPRHLQQSQPSEVSIKIESQSDDSNTNDGMESINSIIEPRDSVNSMVVRSSDGKKQTVIHDPTTIEYIRSFCFKDIFNKMTEEQKEMRARHLIMKKAVVFIDVRSNMRGTEFDESRRFHCTFCPLTIQTQRKFRNAEDLYRHHCQHLRYRPFKCPVEDCQATYYRRDHLHTHVLRHHPWKSFSPERLTGFKKQQEFVGATSNFVVPIDQRTSAYHHFRLNSMPTLLDSVQKKEQSLKNDINTVS